MRKLPTQSRSILSRAHNSSYMSARCINQRPFSPLFSVPLPSQDAGNASPDTPINQSQTGCRALPHSSKNKNNISTGPRPVHHHPSSRGLKSDDGGGEPISRSYGIPGTSCLTSSRNDRIMGSAVFAHPLTAGSRSLTGSWLRAFRHFLYPHYPVVRTGLYIHVRNAAKQMRGEVGNKMKFNKAPHPFS